MNNDTDQPRKRRSKVSDDVFDADRFSDPANVQYRAMVVAHILVAARLYLPGRHVVVRIADLADIMGRAAAIEFNTYIAGAGQETKDVQFFFPATWWQHFKQRWFPKWAIRRWPVRMSREIRKVTIYKAVCPHIHVDPAQGRDTHFAFLAKATLTPPTPPRDPGNP